MRKIAPFPKSTARTPVRNVAARLALVCVAACGLGLVSSACGGEFDPFVEGNGTAETHTAVKPRVVLDGLVELSARTSGGLYIEEVFLHAPTVQLRDGQTPIESVLDSDPNGQSSLFFHYSLFQGGSSGVAVGGDREWDLRTANTLADPNLAFTFAPYNTATPELEALVAAHGCDLSILEGHSAVVQGYVAVESLESTAFVEELFPTGTKSAQSDDSNGSGRDKYAGDGDGAPAAGDGDGAPADLRDLAMAGDGDGSPARGDRNAGDGDGAPAAGDRNAGDGDGAPAAGDGDGAPAAGDGDGAPAAGDGDGAPAAGDGDGAPAAGDGDGAPAAGDGDGAPAAGDGDGAPAAGDGDGAPAGNDYNSDDDDQKSGKYADQDMGMSGSLEQFTQDGQRLVPFLVVIPVGMTLDVAFDEFAPATIAPGAFLPIDLHVDADRLFSTAVMDALELSAEETSEGSVVLRLQTADTQGVFGVELEKMQLKTRYNVGSSIKAPIGR